MAFTPSQIIEAKIEKWIKTDPQCRIKWSEATARELSAFSKYAGRKYSDLINETFELDQIADNIPEIKKVLENLRVRVSDTTKTLCEIQNEKSGIAIKAQSAKAKSDSIDNLCTRLENGTALTDGAIAEGDKFLLDKSVTEHIATEAFNDTIKENADLLAEAGVKTIFVRHLGTDGCCEWCREVAGAYSYETLPDDFWCTHDNCDCWIEYKTEKVHHKITYGRNAYGSKYKQTESM